jgi:hypothetical protein
VVEFHQFKITGEYQLALWRCLKGPSSCAKYICSHIVIGQIEGVTTTVVLIGWWLIRTTVLRSMKLIFVIKAEVLEHSSSVQIELPK